MEQAADADPWKHQVSNFALFGLPASDDLALKLLHPDYIYVGDIRNICKIRAWEAVLYLIIISNRR